MSALAAYSFEDQLVRVRDMSGEPWFVGRDVCAALELASVGKALQRLPDDEKGVYNVHTLGGNQEMIIISEAGMYRLVLTSRTAAAERFKKWVVSDVLPSIRRTGSYAMGAANDADLPGDVIDFETETGRAAILTKLALVRVAGRTFGRGAAQEAWRRAGLPDVDARAADGYAGIEDQDVRDWLAERVEFAPMAKVQSSTLHADYASWCIRNGRTVRSLTYFGRRMRTVGVAFHRSGNIFAIGIRLKSAPAPLPE